MKASPGVGHGTKQSRTSTVIDVFRRHSLDYEVNLGYNHEQLPNLLKEPRGLSQQPHLKTDPMWVPVPSFAYENTVPFWKQAEYIAPAPPAPPGLTPPTTLVFRNVPKLYDRGMLAELFDSKGYAGAYDLIYFPIDFKKRRGLGYVIVNFASHDQALRAVDTFSGFSDWKGDYIKACEVGFSDSKQGLEANVEYLRNREMMHPEVPDMYKPVLYKNGERVAFPAPTKNIELAKHVIDKCKQSRQAVC
jgi:hypothetical protein